jgi:hypothetical protein
MYLQVTVPLGRHAVIQAVAGLWLADAVPLRVRGEAASYVFLVTDGHAYTCRDWLINQFLYPVLEMHV